MQRAGSLACDAFDRRGRHAPPEPHRQQALPSVARPRLSCGPQGKAGVGGTYDESMASTSRSASAQSWASNPGAKLRASAL